MYKSSCIRFEIPGFGLSKFTPESFTKLLVDTAEMTTADILSELGDAGWTLDVMINGTLEKLSRIEWVAIWGECNAYALP
jgi:hypothetical protein